jgi:hypothetical protein
MMGYHGGCDVMARDCTGTWLFIDGSIIVIWCLVEVLTFATLERGERCSRTCW